MPGSETIVKAKNGRLMMKCTCAECGITKTKLFGSPQAGGDEMTGEEVGFLIIYKFSQG